MLALLFSVLSAAMALPLATGAAPQAPAPEPFDAATWQQLRQQVEREGRPQLLMFSASWCAVCPGVLKQLADDARRRRSQTPLLLVFSDLSPEELAQPGHGHHARHGGADRLLGFEGQAAAIRHAVDPRWRGLVPLVVWLAPGQPPELVQGAPDAATLARWWARN